MNPKNRVVPAWSVVGALKSISTYVEVFSALVANLAAGLGLLSKYFGVLSLPLGQKDTGILFSIILSLLAILVVWWTLEVPTVKATYQVRRRLLLYAFLASAGFVLSVVSFKVIEVLWKTTNVHMAELLIDIGLPLAYGIGHGFVSMFLCSVGVLLFVPGIGLIRSQDTRDATGKTLQQDGRATQRSSGRKPRLKARSGR